MEFLKRSLHINVKIDDEKQNISLPNYMITRYEIRQAWFDRQKVFLLYPKTELEQISMIKKHMQRLQSIELLPVVLILRQITARFRQGLIDAGIPFVVENRQCYLPFMGTILTERCDIEADMIHRLLPSAQMLLFYYIYNNKKELYVNEAVESLGVSAMTITRAVRQLEQVKLIYTYKQGVMKIISSEYPAKDLFEVAKGYLISPVKRKQYLLKSDAGGNLLVAGYQALSMYSMLNPPRVGCYATADAEQWEGRMQDILTDDLQQVELQIWKYNPCVLTKSDAVDVLSLAMCFQDDPDERVVGAIEEMVSAYWRSRLDGKRN